MIKQNDKFICYHKYYYQDSDTGYAVNGHYTLGGQNVEGNLAFNGKVFVCSEVKRNHRRGVYIVTKCGRYELREDHFRFEAV